MEFQFSSVQLLSHVQLFATPWTAARQASLFITNSWSLLKHRSIDMRCHSMISSSINGVSDQIRSVTQSCPTLCDPMDCSMPGFPVHHYLPEFAQTHVHWVSDAILPSHPLQPPSPLALNLSQNQGFFQWVGSSHQVAKVLEFQLQHQSFQWIFKVDWLVWLGQGLIRVDLLVWSSCCPRDSQESSAAPQFENINSLVFSLLYGPTLTSVHD